MQEEKVSVIIPTTDKELCLAKRCAYSVNNSTYKNIEVLIINENKKRSYQRNIGIKKAKGKYILYLDSDQYVNKYLIEECVSLMKDFDALYIPEKIIEYNFFSRLRNWERQFYTGTAVDCVRFIKKDKCPYFDENIEGPEDADHTNNIKGKKGITKNYLFHDDRISFIKYLRKKAYYTKSMNLYKKKWPNDKVLNFWYRCFGIFIEEGKVLRVLSRPHYAICLMGLVFLRGLIYLCVKKY